MIPAGYMYKAVVSPRPEWMEAAIQVERISSVSDCCSKPFSHFIDFWRHNGYWFFDSPAVMREIADENGIDLSGQTLFFYEVHPFQYDQDEDNWRPVGSDLPFPVAVTRPIKAQLLGFDVVSFSLGTSAECSPLSCNSLAAELATNSDCLFDRFDDAKAALERGAFTGGEPGPYRILAVYRVDE